MKKVVWLGLIWGLGIQAAVVAAPEPQDDLARKNISTKDQGVQVNIGTGTLLSAQRRYNELENEGENLRNEFIKTSNNLIDTIIEKLGYLTIQYLSEKRMNYLNFYLETNDKILTNFNEKNKDKIRNGEDVSFNDDMDFPLGKELFERVKLFITTALAIKESMRDGVFGEATPSSGSLPPTQDNLYVHKIIREYGGSDAKRKKRLESSTMFQEKFFCLLEEMIGEQSKIINERKDVENKIKNILEKLNYAKRENLESEVSQLESQHQILKNHTESLDKKMNLFIDGKKAIEIQIWQEKRVENVLAKIQREEIEKRREEEKRQEEKKRQEVFYRNYVPRKKEENVYVYRYN